MEVWFTEIRFDGKSSTYFVKKDPLKVSDEMLKSYFV